MQAREDEIIGGDKKSLNAPSEQDDLFAAPEFRELYRETYGPEYEPIIDWALSLVEINMRHVNLTLEIGCGLGLSTAILQNKLTPSSIKAIDKSAYAIDECKLAASQNPKLQKDNFVHGTWDSLAGTDGFESGSFDFVFASFVFYDEDEVKNDAITYTKYTHKTLVENFAEALELDGKGLFVGFGGDCERFLSSTGSLYWDQLEEENEPDRVLRPIFADWTYVNDVEYGVVAVQAIENNFDPKF